MRRQRKPAKAPTETTISGWHIVWQHQRRLFTVMAVILVSLLVLGGLKLNSHLDKLSDKDFAAIKQAAEGVMNSVGATGVVKYEYCRHRAPEVYAGTRLYCGIELAAYLPYRSDAQAIETAKELERETMKLGQTISHIADLLAAPHDAYTSLSVTLQDPLPRQQCHFTIATGERGGRAASNLIDKSGRDLIGIAFYCSAESREKYFKVIDD